MSIEGMRAMNPMNKEVAKSSELRKESVKKDKEIEQLKKGKEWLIVEWTMDWYRKQGYPALSTKQIRGKIINKMQKVLKEK